MQHNSNWLLTIGQLASIEQLHYHCFSFLADKLWHSFHLMKSYHSNNFREEFQAKALETEDRLMLVLFSYASKTMENYISAFVSESISTYEHMLFPLDPKYHQSRCKI